jgi:hypothetical protein
MSFVAAITACDGLAAYPPIKRQADVGERSAHLIRHDAGHASRRQGIPEALIRGTRREALLRGITSPGEQGERETDRAGLHAHRNGQLTRSGRCTFVMVELFAGTRPDGNVERQHHVSGRSGYRSRLDAGWRIYSDQFDVDARLRGSDLGIRHSERPGRVEQVGQTRPARQFAGPELPPRSCRYL